MACPNCGRKVSFWRLKCRVCHRYVWRIPHIIFVGIVGLAVLAGLIWFVEFLATRR